MGHIRDCLYESIELSEREIALLEDPCLKRLRHIRQLGFAEAAFPCATHTRFSHSIGTCEMAERMWSFIHQDRLPKDKTEAFRQILRLCALCHDIGHGPFSHSSETLMPLWDTLARKAKHEDYTHLLLLHSSLSQSLDELGRDHGFGRREVAAVLGHSGPFDEAFFHVPSNGQNISFLPLLSQILSSEIDCDRLDYLGRDAYMTGVKYGECDTAWLIRHLGFEISEKKSYLSLDHRALYAFEDFLLSRHHMFLNVYFHRLSVIYDAMLEAWAKENLAKRQLPTDITAYTRMTDDTFRQILRDSDSPWAHRILERKPYQMVEEWHSHLKPTGDPSASLIQLQAEGKRALRVQSKGVLSKYTRSRNDFPIFVRFESTVAHRGSNMLHEVSHIFEKYRDERSMDRIYIHPDDIKKKEGR